jgi:F0F1-type ATP synthase assembly protein I
MDTGGDIGKPGGFGNKWGREFGPFLTLGLQLAITVVGFFFLGQWLDRKLETSPWLMLTGLAIGILGGLIKFLKTAMEIGKKSDSNSKNGDTEA